MKRHDKLIYVVGTISMIVMGLLVIGGIALSLITRIDAATDTHAQREAARLAELPREEEPVEEVGFVIENIVMTSISGTVYWETSDNSSEGIIIFYENNDGSISISESRSEFPQGIQYSEEVTAAIEREFDSFR